MQKNNLSPSHRVHRTLLLLAALSTGAYAADLDSWIEEVDQTNPSVKAAYQKWQASKSAIKESTGWEDPMIGVNVARDNTKFSDYDMLEYMLEQEIPWPSQKSVAGEIARLESEATGFEYLEVRRQTRAKIASAYWELWQNREILRIMGEQSALLESLASGEQARMESGQSSQSNWLRLRIEKDQLNNDRISMEREAGIALAKLNALLNAGPGTPRSTEHLPPLPELTVSVEQLQKDARQYCCILMATLWREMAKDLARKAAGIEQRPSLSVRVEARQMRESGDIEEYDTGIALNFPWLWQGKYKGRRTGAEADYQMAAAELEAEINMTMTDIQEMHTMAEARGRNMKLLEESTLPNTRALAASARESYTTGMMPAMELIDAQNMLLEAEMNFAKEKAAYATAYAKLMSIAQPWGPDEFETGLPLHKGNTP